MGQLSDRMERAPEFLVPVGTVTLLLADLERSVRQWEADEEAAMAATSRMNEVVDEAVARHSGVRPVEQGGGDSFVAAFTRATDAVACALEIQLALREGPLRFRIGVHTGEVQIRDEGDYIGRSINRAARLRDIAHGGQTLLSRPTHDLVVDQLPPEVALADLGTHRLRDLARSEHVFQLRHPELRDDFPPLRSLNVVPNNLPPQLTSFIGRRREIDEIKRLIAETHLLTLTGSGGCGKTRLALQAAAELLDTFRDGAWIVDFSRISTPDLVPKTVADALGLPDEQYKDFVGALVEYIKNKQLLVIFDNCEHLARACAEFADVLLYRCPTATLVATSREPLGIPGETPWRVPSLSFPADDDLSLESLLTCEAIQLFVERARRSRPNFMLSASNASDVVEVCRRLDGIPLAIELAAARVRVLTVRQICEGLADRFRLLTGGSRTLMPRQQTLQASVDWSFGLLSEAEQILLRRLSVFAGGFTLPAAEFVSGGEGLDSYQVLDVLSELVDRSLVQMNDEGEIARFALLETIRQYGRDKLVDAGEAAAARTQHREFYLALAERAGAELSGHNRELWLEQLDAEHDNLRVAMEWSEQEHDTVMLLRLATSLVLFWRYRGFIAEGNRWLDVALARAVDPPAAVEACALWASAYLKTMIMDESGASRAEQAFELFRRLDDRRGIARCLWTIAWEAAMADDPRCEELFRDCERLSRECADEWCLAAALEGLGFVHLMRGSLPESRRIFEEGLEVARRSGDQLRGHWISSWLGWVMVSQGEAAGGMPILQATVADLRRSKDIVFTGFALMALGVAHIYLGNYAQGRECLDESHAIEKQTGSVVQPLLLMWNARSMLAMGEDATEVLELARAAHRIQSRPLGIQFALETVGRAELACGAIAAAREHLDDVIATYRLSGNAPMLATPLILRAAVSVEEGDDRGAETLLHEALALQQDTQDRFGAIDAFEALASIAVNQESLVEAVRLYGSAAAMRAQTGYVRFPSERPTYEARLNIAKEELGPEAFEAAWADGASLSMEEAIAYARRGRGERKRPSSGWDSVTPAEADVIALVAERLDQPPDRRAAVHLEAHGADPPVPDLPQARRLVPGRVGGRGDAPAERKPRCEQKMSHVADLLTSDRRHCR